METKEISLEEVMEMMSENRELILSWPSTDPRRQACDTLAILILQREAELWWAPDDHSHTVHSFHPACEGEPRCVPTSEMAEDILKSISCGPS